MNKIKSIFPIIAVLLSMLMPTVAQAALPSTAVPEAKQGRDWWMPRHAEKVAQAKAGKAELVMIGDSITHYWEKQPNYAERFGPYHTLNLGFGGDRTQNVVWRLQNGEVDGIAPKLVTLMIGTNNTSRDTPEAITAGIQAIVAELRQRLPESKIVVLSVFPRSNPRTKGDFERVKAINQLLPGIADNEWVFHVDINRHFLDENGQLRPELYGRDLLHLSGAGYEAWHQALLPILKDAGLEASEARQ